MNDQAWDLIGDIHGHAGELEVLLKALGYSQRNGAFRHPERRVIFLGDYIDRGRDVARVLEIVRGMVEAGEAIALMGNHEFNALCWATLDPHGKPLRPHDAKNHKQHAATLSAFQHDHERWADHLRWFRTLPLQLETGGLRAVHATWDPQHLEVIDAALDNGPMSDDFLIEAGRKGGSLHRAVETVLKGRELLLPEGQGFKDKDGHLRQEVRIRWWVEPHRLTYRELAFPHRDDMPEVEVPADLLADAWHYPAQEPPVFFGHYWLREPHPAIIRDNICCLDLSVAKGGHLTAYRFDGEQVLDPARLVSVPAANDPAGE
jgi:hypothetical protein